MNDPNQTADHKPAVPPVAPPGESQPERIGRYRVERVLGRGGFGLVYLAHDEQLRRPVAIKVAHPERVTRPEDAEAYLAEARTVAGLDHPHIVPVYDVGGDATFPVFVVAKFIDGTDLARRLKQSRLSHRESVELVAVVAEALHHAHRQGLVHRDIKPGNLLLDREGKPYVADFGLALREQDVGHGPRHAGTPQYMSPEQARGEGHRVDGRSDIFSLGAVLYELLTGRRPFHGDTLGELLDQITSVEAKPPRQIDETIPKELERICLKCLSKRATDRYPTARDLADDLRHLLGDPSVSSVARGSGEAAAVPTPLPSPRTPADSDRDVLRIVPKGLRSFDAGDADFFLELLPGPRDRDGLPDSLRFWKSRIEQPDAENTFTVGLIYGPSGCGKSSLVKAGLLPRLADSVIAVYVEATAEDTETRLLNGLRKKLPALDHRPLKETLAALRRGVGIPAGKKVLIVLDQFEQWLHAKKDEDNTELVQALRQCDGGRVQAVVMVRDDFWLAVSRFMRDLEVRLVEGQNSALVDLFDQDHARKVLAAFGRAFGKLPENPGDMNREHRDFLTQSVAGLAQDGKVISVRLSLFAEMMKGKAWTPAALKAVGGTAGVGVTFLEETFSAGTAPPEHRYHQKAARGVLKALLPESGTEIKGHMRSRQELLDASGYAGRDRDFDDLLRILDGEIRLITPTDPEGKSTDDDSTSSTTRPGEKYYQLTHDYLVPSLRDWLTRKQKETRRGRAELLLADRAAVWNARPENRQLPSLFQWLQIRWHTAKAKWTPPQAKMMAKATRVHATRAGTLAVLLAVVTFTGWAIWEQNEARLKANQEQAELQRKETLAAGLVQSLINAETAQVPAIVAQMADYRQWVDPQLREAHDKPDATPRQKLHTGLALLPVDVGQVDGLVARLLDAEPHEVPVLRDALAPHQDALRDRLWAVVERPEMASRAASAPGAGNQRLRAAAALAKYDPDGVKWPGVQEAVGNDLVRVPAVFLAPWMEALRPVRSKLYPQLAAIYRDTARREVERSLATDILADYAADNPPQLADLLMDADEKQFAVIYPKLRVQATATRFLDAEMDHVLKPQWPALPRNWPAAPPGAIDTLTRADGLLAEAFAFCQSLPIEQFQPLAEQLRVAGYRPTRVRPYAHDRSIRVAALWTRDGRNWRVVLDRTAEELPADDAQQRQAGFAAVDVAGYVANLDGKDESRYCGLWVQAAAPTDDARIYVGVLTADHKRAYEEVEKAGYPYQQCLHSFRDPAGVVRLSGVKSKSGPRGYWGWDGTARAFRTTSRAAELPWDVAIAAAIAPQSPRQRYEAALARAEAALKDDPDDTQAQFDRGLARFNLDRNEDALKDFTAVLKANPRRAVAYQYRAVLHARLGDAAAAETDRVAHDKLTDSAATKVYLKAIVLAHAGKLEEARSAADAFYQLNRTDSGAVYDVACIYSIVSKIVGERDRAEAEKLAARSVALLGEAIDRGYSEFDHIRTDADFDPVRERPDFARLLLRGETGFRYSGVWNAVPDREAERLMGLTPAEQHRRAGELLAQGYRPVALSVCTADGGTLAASVWHRPLIRDEEKESLAKRQSNAAVALLRLNQPEKVWPLLKHSPDPRVRSYLIHRLFPLGADPAAIVQRLEAEPDLSSRRALLLALGEFDEPTLPAASRTAVLPKVQSLYRDDPDPGLHAAAEWLLRQWKQDAWIKQVNADWAKASRERERPEFPAKNKAPVADAPGSPKTPRQWYVNGQGQTYVVIPGPVEFRMGSPPTEKDHEDRETPHQRRIGRSFAIASKSVTLEEYRRLTKDQYEIGEKYTYDPNLPVVGVNWYMAARYCNLLSKAEGIPEDQWCYEVTGPQDIKLKGKYLGLTGYRLPTEAEVEYATRAEAVTSRYYGETEELLGRYAWYTKSSNDVLKPVGLKKPNDFGLFDSQGNCLTWCQEEYAAYPERAGAIEDPEGGLVVISTRSRVLRGGSFYFQASDVRSASRYSDVPPTRNTLVSGFRPARTFTP